MARQTPESKIINSIKKYLTSLTVNNILYFEHRSAGSPGFKSGVADLFIVIDGQHIELEVKAPEGELRPEQIKWAERCAILNIPCYVVRSVDEVKSIITIYKKIKI